MHTEYPLLNNPKRLRISDRKERPTLEYVATSGHACKGWVFYRLETERGVLLVYSKGLGRIV